MGHGQSLTVLKLAFHQLSVDKGLRKAIWDDHRFGSRFTWVLQFTKTLLAPWVNYYTFYLTTWKHEWKKEVRVVGGVVGESGREMVGRSRNILGCRRDYRKGKFESNKCELHRITIRIVSKIFKRDKPGDLEFVLLLFRPKYSEFGLSPEIIRIRIIRIRIILDHRRSIGKANNSNSNSDYFLGWVLTSLKTHFYYNKWLFKCWQLLKTNNICIWALSKRRSCLSCLYVSAGASGS